MSNGLFKKNLIICVVALFCFYVAINTAGTFKFVEVSAFLTYDKLAQSLLRGQLSMQEKVHPDRAKAEKPCDPSLGIPFITDAVIWNGKYYFLQEPFPVLFHVLWIAVTGLACPTGFMVIAYALGSLICLWILISFIRRRFCSEAPGWIHWYVWLLFAFSAAQLYMVSRPVVYHEAIVAGMFFILVGLVFYVQGFLTDKSWYWFAASGMAMGCGLMSRNILVFYPVVFFFILLVYALRHPDFRIGLAAKVGAFIIPVVLSVGVLMTYNYVRFGEPLNFGRTSICFPIPELYTYVIENGRSFRLSHVWPNVINYFWSTPILIKSFPYIFHGHWKQIFPDGTLIRREMISSLLVIMPGILLVVPTPLFLRSLKKSLELQALIAGFVVGSLAIFVLLLTYYRAVGRYLYEFTPLLYVVMYCNTVSLWEWAKPSVLRRRILCFILIVLFLGQALGGIFLAFNGITQR